MNNNSIRKWLSVLALVFGLLSLTLISKQTDTSQASLKESASPKVEPEEDLKPEEGKIPSYETNPKERTSQMTEPIAEPSAEQKQDETVLEETETETSSTQSNSLAAPPEAEMNEPETETEEPVYFRENREISQYSKVIMVGDSRFVGMSSAVSFSGCEWICDVGTGLDWLENTAAPQIDTAVTENCAIVFNMGVNDIDRASGYVDFLNSRVDQWTSAGADVYFMTVNPVDRSLYSGVVTNEAIVNFNNIMAANLSPWFGYIDTYQDLSTNGFTSRDGLHYTNETYVKIFQYCMNQLHVSIS